MAPVVAILKNMHFCKYIFKSECSDKSDVLYYHCFLTLLQDMRLGMPKKYGRDWTGMEHISFWC